MSDQLTLPVSGREIPAGYVEDAKGRFVTEASIRPVQQLEDQMVRKVLGYAVELHNQIQRFKGHVFADTGSYMSLAEEEYGATKRGAKGRGNVTFMTFDGLMKVQIAVADRLSFGPELQVARALFDECISDWTEDARDELDQPCVPLDDVADGRYAERRDDGEYDVGERSAAAGRHRRREAVAQCTLHDEYVDWPQRRGHEDAPQNPERDVREGGQDDGFRFKIGCFSIVCQTGIETARCLNVVPTCQER